MNIELTNPMAPPFNLGMGWLFVALAIFFLLGLLPRFARRFYPHVSPVVRRAATPIVFALLAAACFGGWGVEALGFVVVAGMAQIVVARRRLQREGRKNAARSDTRIWRGRYAG